MGGGGGGDPSLAITQHINHAQAKPGSGKNIRLKTTNGSLMDSLESIMQNMTQMMKWDDERTYSSQYTLMGYTYRTVELQKNERHAVVFKIKESLKPSVHYGR